ncbi:MAG: fibronectin type III domain-containing protein, partial [Prevotella sp.]|nr:fibronectin type III domain-containing protein [Prevotella sp.]
MNYKPWTEWGNGENQWCHDNYTYNDLTGSKGAISVDNMLPSNLVSALGSDNWKLDDSGAVPKMFTTPIVNPWATMSASDMVAALGSDWEVVDGKAVPVMRTTTTAETSEESFSDKLGSGWTKENGALMPATRTIEYVIATIVTHKADDFKEFYHKNTGRIDKTLLTQTRQSSVLLTWNTDGNPIDYFRVLRRVKDQGENAWKEVATDLSDMSYEDTTVSPLATYEYKVQGVNDCEGRDSTETEVKVGECKHTGRVDGYVRFNDGTSAAGIEVEIAHDGTKVSVFTDDSGHFVADELSYFGNPEVTYEVSAVSREGVEFSPKRASVTFDAHSNDETLREISILNGKRFSGFVMYDGTSIPVKGANFMVNGQKVYNTKGKLLETEYDGSFSFRVLPGNDTIQVVMDGHTFTNGGYYKGPGGHTFTDDVANTYFYDDTKVKLTGRVVGGDEQGKKPLMNNLSTNNLGDSLRMVLTLEGDNTSWLVYDNLNPNRTKREEVVRHQRKGDKHYTSVTTERKRMTIWPDPTTGEYEVLLPPVRWKVQQVYCTGYPTLFQEGQVSEVVDLTDCLTPKDTTVVGSFRDVDTTTVVDPKATYHAVYNRIYHAPVEVTYKQITYGDFNYFGDKNYYATELTGEMAEVPLAYLDPIDSVTVHYTFKYPVFSVERKYTIELQVGENYPYNNDPAGKVDIVRLGGGFAAMQNGLNPSAPAGDPVEVDSLGRARFTLTAGQTPVLLTKESALKTVTFTVLRDGTYLEAKPLQGFVLNMFPVGDSKDILTDGHPVLFDILRDPPGAYSSSTLAKGTTLNYSYAMNLTLMAGVSLWYNSGKELQILDATVVAPAGSGKAVGPISAGQTEEGTVNELMYNAQGSKAFSHTMVVGNNISTSGDPSMVGADADLYIGAVQNVVVTPMSTIRAVNKKMFNQIAGRQGGVNTVSEVGKNVSYGTMVKIAEGKDAKGDTLYLIRDVALGYGPKIQSQFVYSQKKILTEIIPEKAKEIVDMMFCGTKAEAQAVADSTHKAVYWSLREPTDTMFAVVNKQLEGHAYNDYIEKAEKGINYMVVRPTGTKSEDFKDEVTEKYQILKNWAEMIAQNELEKLTARDLLTNYDIAGAAGVNYSETYDASYSESWTHHFPVATEVDFFGPGVGYAASFLSIAGTIVGSFLASMAEMKYWKQPTVDSYIDKEGKKVELTFSGDLLQFRLTPVALYSTVGANSSAKSYNRTETFTIACDPMSRLNVDVYRVKPLYASASETSEFHGVMNPRFIDKDSVGLSNIFTNYQFDKMSNLVSEFVGKEEKKDGILGPRGFVYRTRGGATQNPWEDKRVTQFYNPGRTLDERTLKIVNPRIRLDKQSVSGVSVDDAAKFTIFVSNESEKPEATEGLTVLQLFAADQANPLGAKISVNGQPLTTGGMTISVVPGMETALTMEVRAGQGFDFDGLTIGVMSPTDAVNTKQLVSFNVHFLREAGGVNIAVPGDKWVLNTTAQVDAKRGWYLPVTINGFDRHQHNFDHIEFQYKESQRGDDSWTNICSFYADPALMANANGVSKLIPENGNIITEFYGEGWVTERNYDLRAVLFCRNGNDFLTTSSKIISGIKDTRRPQLFGTPEPKSGILTAGDDIVFNFSEDIENNYLSAITNFEVKGEVNTNHISEMVSVQFNGTGSVETEA